MAQELEQRARVWKQQKTTLLLHKKVLREQLTLRPGHPAAGEAQKLLLSLPRRIEARLTITQLLQWSKQLLQLIAAFHEARDPSFPDQVKEDPAAESDPQDRSCRKKTSDRSEIQFRHINTNNTKQTLSNERSSERALPVGNDFKKDLTANAEKALEKVERERAAPARQHPSAHEDRSNSPPLPGLEPPSAQAVLLRSGIEHITLKQVLACASPMLRDMIRNASKSGGADWDSVIQAATLAAGYLGISKPAWQEACSKLGSSAAATLIVIAERRSTDPNTSINSYGGFVRGCLAKAQAGDLHLQKSVFGLLSKANLDD
ncbi:replication initiation protein RepC [Pseudovibrio ascidiaceicola]|uniref:replication initiation protein RepC n=1 Tax=Pseudovibrio ascidiaceicola TaxID=285279 RepID=UPI003D359BA6